MFETLVTRLQLLFASSASIPIVRDWAEVQVPFIRSVASGGGDLYGGYSSNHYLELQLDRPGTGLLHVVFSYSLHELSGQCDDWSVRVTGAVEADRAPLWELFHPRQQTHFWNNHVGPSFEFNGVKSAYEAR